MALFKPYKILSSQLNSLPITEGQFIVTTDDGSLYVDISNSTRLKVIDVSGKEDKTNRVTSVSASSTDTQYPSAKCLYDLSNTIMVKEW